MSEIREVVDGKVQEPEAAKPIQSTNQNPMFQEGMMDKMAVAQVLGLDNFSEIDKADEQIMTILDWAKLEGYKDSYELKNMVRQLQDRLGSPPLTETWLARVSRYAHLVLESNKIEEQKAQLAR